MTPQTQAPATEPIPEQNGSEAKGLLIWVKCACPTLSPVLEGALRAEETRVHRGDAPPPPEGPHPSLWCSAPEGTWIGR